MISWDYIEGPVGAYFFTGFGKRIWLFGDRHVLSFACATTKGLEGSRVGRLEHVIADLAPQMEMNGKTLDVLVEAQPLGIEREQDVRVQHDVSNYMDTLNVFLGMCHVKGACSYPNVRFHAADARKYIDILDNLLGVAVRASSAMFNILKTDYVPWTDVSDEIIREIASVLVVEKDIPVMEVFIDFFSEKGCTTVRDVFNELLDMANILDMVDEIENESHKAFMVEYIRGQLQGAGPDSVGFLTMKLDDVLKNERNTVYFLCQMMEDTDWIMEVPLLATLLWGDVSNAIVFAGFMHIKQIATHMEALGFDLEFEHLDLDSQCMLWPGTGPLL